MFKRVVVFLLPILCLHCQLQAVISLGEDQFDCGYQATTNPEKGSYGLCELTHQSKDYSQYGLDTGTDSYGDAYRYEYTLCYGKIILSSFLNSSIDAGTLARIDQHFSELKVAGVKPIVRIMYANDIGESDTTLAWVETHLQQLQPIFDKHSGIIAWFQGGIIGAWGEWHSSSNGLDTTENKVAVYDLLHTYLPASPACLKIQIRYPMIMPSLVADLISSDEDAFNDATCSKAQRLGFHNDCWMSSWHDTGTYEYNGAYNQAAREHWLPYLENVTRYSPYGGETCIDTTTGSLWTEFNCSFIFQEAEQLHATFLNPNWHPDVTKHMRDHCCWEEFIDRTGYRFELQSAHLSSSPSPSPSSAPLSIPRGGSMSYQLDIANTGWGSLYSQRRGYLSLFQYQSRGDMQTVEVDGVWEEEWNEVATGFDDATDTSSTAVADVREVRVTNDAEYLYLLIRFYSVTEGNALFSNGFFKVFFDTDNSPASGYSTGVIGGKIGSELLLEGSNFYDQRSGGFSDGSVSDGFITKVVSADGLNVEMRIDRQMKYSDETAVFPDNGSVTMVVNIGDTSWNLVDFSPKTLNGYMYSFRNTQDVILRHDHDLGADLREWRGENGVTSLTGSVEISSDFMVSTSGGTQENITVGLWFPDPSSELMNHTRLSIQLGTTVTGGYWNGNIGVNMLPLQINVTDAVLITCFTITSSTKT